MIDRKQREQLIVIAVCVVAIVVCLIIAAVAS